MRILPDGTVEIRNKKTGETKIIQPNDLGSYGIPYSDYVEQAKAFQQIPGNKEIISDKPVATKQKDTQTLSAVNNFINNLEKRYQEGGGAKSSIGPLNRLLGLVTSAGANLGLNDPAKLYENERKGFAATLKQLTGDTGVLTEQDFQRLSALIPGLGATQGEAVGGFNDLRSQVAAKFGGEAQSTNFDPSVYKPAQTGNKAVDTLKGNDIINFLLGTAINSANDIGMSVKTRNVQPEVDKLLKEVESLSQLSNTVTDPVQKKQLLDLAKNLADEAGNISGENVKGFSEDVTMNPLIRGLLSGAQIAGTAEIPGFAKGGVKAIANAPKNIKNALGKVASQEGGSALRNAAVDTAEAAGKTVNGSKITTPLKEWADTAKLAHPNKSATIDKMITTIENQVGKDVSPKKLFNLWDEANNGFKATTGDARKTLEASFHRAVRSTVRKELDTVAPGFEKGTDMIRRGIRNTELLKNTGRIAGGAAVTGTTFAILNKILNAGRNQPY